ncbi:hypothetical protein [Lacrimispora defluvii]|uniref:Uncharacterized protein n=1 Tax=Lacrimispora defluvii TaxID=2719233 RepID=A0ABX1W3Q0_9FIRM|nr:hypothetical protein [Lacrimispora defluvii]NNJ33331.1 hypothetical protein [Lacrimispora defluvii]
MKKTGKKLLAAIVVSLNLAALGSEVVYAQPSTQQPAVPPVLSTYDTQSYSPLSDIIGWRYKSVDGHVYRRQYNYSKEKWIGDWEAC